MHKRNFSTVHCGATLTCGYLLFCKPDELFVYRTDGYSDFDLSLKKNRTQPSHKICSDIIAFASSLRRQDRTKVKISLYDFPDCIKHTVYDMLLCSNIHFLP